MPNKQTDPMQAFAGPASDMFKFWISFWPVAPMFGVEWRFAGAMPGMPQGFGPSERTSTGRAGSKGRRPAASTNGVAAQSAPDPAADAAVKEAIRDAETALEALAAERATPATAEAEPAVAKQDAKAPGKAAPKATKKSSKASEESDSTVVAFEQPAAKPARAEPVAAAPTAEMPDASRPSNLFDTAPDEVDDLKLIKGIGPGLESKLNALGVYRLDQMSAFSDDDLRWIDDNLTAFKGRCFRDDWVAQAKSLLG